ncbi:MAG TPA: hypothetical protein VM469_12220 [Pseudoxanthomonas sp.]|jgi:hypothetical protein|nr:hypothetical protein [Pseudoxanthomonas sp.]
MREPARTQAEILRDIRQFSPSQGDWRPLDTLLDELWTVGPPELEAISILFNVFERFPDDDGAGVLWSIVHGVESLAHDYEPLLVASNRRAPSHMAAVMLARLATRDSLCFDTPD